jgi:hypothetical protein
MGTKELRRMRTWLTGFGLLAFAGAAAAWGQSNAPVCVVDDFQTGVAAWTNADSGSLEWVAEGASGHLRWRAADDGIGHIRFLGIGRLDLAAYDRLRFRYRVSGKTLTNLNPILQQFPFMQGFRALYWSVDTLDVKLGEWQTYVQELDKVENSWPDTYSRTAQEFEFEVHQLPGAERTVIELDDIVLEKNVLGLERTYPGKWSAAADGSQGYDFRIPVRNVGDHPIRIRPAPVATSVARAALSLGWPGGGESFELAPGATGEVTATVLFTSEAVKASPPYYGEMAALSLTVEGEPPLTMTALLPAGIRPPAARHPSILCLPDHAAGLRARYLDPAGRKTLSPIILAMAAEAAKALAYEPAYPPLGNIAKDYNKCLIDQTNLVAAAMPNLPEPGYQCPHCGRFYRGLFYQAAMENWYGQHRANSAAAYHAGIGYLLTGDEAYARKTAQILLGYKDSYLKMPVAALTAAVHAPIASSGATRIGGSFMQEQNWLTQLAVGLDCIRGSGALGESELAELSEKMFEPSATLMMNHRVGLMNLQWMIDRAGIFAGMATDNPALVARALYGDHGIVRLLDEGFLKDGFWRENPSYINVMANEGYPALGALLGNGILPYGPEMDTRFKAMWHLAAPDGRFPTLGTGGPPSLDILLNGVKAVAHLTTDPEMAWIDRSNPKVKNVGLYFSCVVAAFQAQGTRVPETEVRPIVAVTTNLPDYGVAVLRVPGSDAYAALAWGRHLVHGHFNKLSVNAYAKGGWFVRNMWGGYGKGFAEFVEPTASSSTVMVDGRSQDADTGELLFLENTPAAQLASARELGAWKDVEHERTVALTGDWMLMLDRLAADKPHVYDWLFHGQGVGKSEALAWADGPGLVDGPPLRLTADTNSCYAFFEPAEGRALTAPVTTIRYTRANQTGVALHLVKTGTALFRTGSATWPHEGLVYRQQAGDAAFVTLFEPLGTNETPRLTVEAVPLVLAETGRPATLREAQAAAVTAGGKRTLVVVNYAGVPLKTADGLVLKTGKRVQVVTP